MLKFRKGKKIYFTNGESILSAKQVKNLKDNKQKLLQVTYE